MLGDDQRWAIKTEGLTREYPGVVAVKNVGLEVVPGTVHGLLGPNGAGKSTTLRMLGGLVSPTSGRALIEGLDPQVSPMQVKSRMGLLLESPPVYGEMTVREYLSFVCSLHGLEKSQVWLLLKRSCMNLN
jgi:ABC-2 type transport system ATP-binding protein